MLSITQLLLLLVSLFTINLIGNSDSRPTRPTQDGHQSIQPRWYNTGFLPYYVNNGLVIGSFNNPTWNLNLGNNFGSSNFYTNTLTSYSATWSGGNGLYGYCALFANNPRYSFFKSKGDHELLTEKVHKSSNQQRRSTLLKRDDRVECRNEKGQPTTFSRSDCDTAAAKMSAEKTAVSNSGLCSLIMVGPSGQLSSSNLPASELQAETQSMLDACQNGPSVSNLSGSNKIPKNANPSYVLMLTKPSN